MWKWAGFRDGWIDGKDHENDDERQRFDYHAWQFILNCMTSIALGVWGSVILILVVLALLNLFAR